ncbi:MAG: thiamine pyrophosphate-binding protein [Lachnospiraceae bacterium]|nr:thiamine pyrophosphate-binding protein [Lachnospiraceae bacterium]
MKISDYIMEFIASLGVGKVFCVTGGGAMHMNNSLGQSKKLTGVFMIHEQGASIAAESYARIHEGYGACLVTSGPGATNALTGLVGAYIDSIPVIYLSGQAKRADLVGNQGIRQFGIQEVDIISMVGSYSKYAVQIRKPEDIRFEMEKAAAVAVNGRPGPVWIDVPLDIQASDVDVESLRSFDTSELETYPLSDETVTEVIKALNEAKKPVMVLGHGIRLGHAVNEARELYNTLQIPVLTSWNGVDLIEEDHPLYYGRPGAVGQRAANLIEQGADLVLTIGTRLNLLSTGYNFDSFLANAKHIMVDIDVHEMEKKSVHPWLKVVCDAKDFIEKLLQRKEEIEKKDRGEWLTHCNELLKKYPTFIPEQSPREGFVSTYHLVKEISNQMTENDIFQFTSSGTSVDISMKTFAIKWGQRAFLTKGLAAMGYDVPASIGSCVASGGKRTVCVTGDGSIAMNMQELEVIKRLNLPIKIFVVDNNGYSMIYQSQFGNFKEHLTGCTKESGLTLPDMKKIAEAFGIHGEHIEEEEKLEEQVAKVLEYDGPVLCTVKGDITQKILPKQVNYMREDGQMASRPIEDMAPLLEREELASALGR